MALADPNAPGVPFLDDGYQMPFPPPEWGYGAPQQVTAAEYPTGVVGTSVGTLPSPPPPPPPPPQQIGAPITSNGNELATPTLPPPEDGAAPPPFDMPVDYVGQGPAPGTVPQADATSAAGGDIDPHQALLNNVGGVAVDAPSSASSPQPGDRDFLSQHAGPEAAAPDISGLGGSQYAELPSVGAKDEQAAVDAKGQYYATHPLDLARDELQTATDKATAERADLARAQMDRDKRDLAAYQVNQVAKAKTASDYAKYQAGVDDAKKQKIDPDQHLGVLASIGNVVALTLGGAMSQYTGGRNLALEQLNKAIETHIQTQRENLSNTWRGLGAQRETIGDQRQQDEQNYLDDQKFASATYSRALDAIATKQQDFDPRGTQSQALGAQYGQILAGKNKIDADVAQKLFDNNVKYAGVQQKQQEIDEASRKDQADEADKLQIAAERLAARKGAGGVGGGASQPLYGHVFESRNDIASVAPKQVANSFPLPELNGKPGGFAVAGSPEEAADATHLSQMYSSANHDLNELTRISLERNGAKSSGGTLWKKWQDTNEQHYNQLVTDLGNTYGMMIHGRAPTKGVLEEVLKDMPQLKAFYEGGDTTTLLNSFHDDIDNRAALRFSQLMGAPYSIKSPRPHVDQPNENTIGAPLTEAPVKGAAGYARLDTPNFATSLDQLAQEYGQNPGTGGNEGLAGQYNDIAIAQRKAASEIQGEIAKLQAKSKRTPVEEAQLRNNQKAYADRQEAINAVEDAKKNHADATGAVKKQREQESEDMIKRELPETRGGGRLQ